MPAVVLRRCDEDRLAAPLLRHEAVVRQLALHPLQIRSGLSILFTATTIGTLAARAWF